MRLLFICTGNSFRSPVAEALTRKYIPEFEVESAGTKPASEIAWNAKELLEREEALKYVKPHPEPLSERGFSEADLVVCMEEYHSKEIRFWFDIDKNKIDVWDIKDPIREDTEPEEAFQEIKEKVEEYSTKG